MGACFNAEFRGREKNAQAWLAQKPDLIYRDFEGLRYKVFQATGHCDPFFSQLQPELKIGEPWAPGGDSPLTRKLGHTISFT